MTGGVVEHKENLPPGRPVPLIERTKIPGEAGALLSATDHLHPPAPPALLAAKDRHPPIHSHRGNPLLPPDPMPLLG
ncbi:MAG: hypothetical protein M3Y58_04225 [Chloroflexota bacterium]|nr:hypothetical protein [Chloroflexota bacterium]